MQKFILIGTIILFSIQLKAQTCNFKISDQVQSFEENYGEDIQAFLNMSFEINGSTFLTNDTTTIEIQLNKAGFDTIHYTYVDQNDKTVNETALCKLRSGQIYTISPCTCCGIFLILPSKNAKRGFVKFKNKSKNEYIASASEMSADTLFKKSETASIFSSISMNCGFRPNRIFIANFAYYDKKYLYDNWKNQSVEGRIKLDQEREGHVVYSFNYLFLHEEKLTVTIGKKDGNFKVQLDSK